MHNNLVLMILFLQQTFSISDIVLAVGNIPNTFLGRYKKRLIILIDMILIIDILIKSIVYSWGAVQFTCLSMKSFHHSTRTPKGGRAHCVGLRT